MKGKGIVSNKWRLSLYLIEHALLTSEWPAVAPNTSLSISVSFSLNHAHMHTLCAHTHKPTHAHMHTPHTHIHTLHAHTYVHCTQIHSRHDRLIHMQDKYTVLHIPKSPSSSVLPQYNSSSFSLTHSLTHLIRQSLSFFLDPSLSLSYNITIVLCITISQLSSSHLSKVFSI